MEVFEPNELVYIPRFWPVTGNGSWAYYQKIFPKDIRFAEAHYLELKTGEAYYFSRTDFVRRPLAEVMFKADFLPMKECSACDKSSPMEENDYLCVWCRNEELDSEALRQYSRFRV